VRLLGTEFADSRIVQKILVTVPEKYEATLTTLENTKDLSNITLAEVLHALKAQEQRRLMRQEGSMEGAFQAKLQINNKGKSPSNKPDVFTHNKNNNQNSNIYPPCPHCKKTNHLQKKCWWRPDARCHRCGQLGHMERVCKSQQQQEEVKVAEDLSQEEQLFAVTCYAAHSSAESWLIDSGCTNHMTYDRELFRELDETIFSKVKIGNGAYIEVKGRGTVAIEGHTGLKLIHDVLYVPEINQNLLSVPQLLEKGYKVLFEDKNCMIKDSEGREVFNVQMKGKSFALDFMNKQQAAVHKEVNSTTLWHKRLGHFHHNALMYLKKNNLAKNSLELEEELPACDVCQYGKQTRLPFPRKSAWRATERLQLIHTDVGGPMRTPSLNGSKYYIVFIDDYTRMCWIYFMKFKSEVAHIFWKFKAWIETQSKCKLQVIRSDNGTEYTCEQFNKFCEDAGIEHQLTAPYSPQQDGTAERKNRTIMEMARCLLHEKELPKKFWAEAANTAVFLLNRLPTKALQKKTPFEAWYGYKPELLNLKIFGCLCFSYIPKVKRDKLDKKAEPGIFVGYSLISKAYRIYLPHNGKVIVSRDVKFLELDSWNWEDNKNIEFQEENEDIDDEPIRGTRSLSDIYQRCNVAIMEPAGYAEAANDKKWINAMEEELKMIEKKPDMEIGGQT
jgi:transposase InsO family protein